MESVFDFVFKVLQILFYKFKSSIVDSMCNLLRAGFRGKFAEAVDLGEKEKLGNSWGVGVCSKTLWNGNSRGVGGSKVKNLPWMYGYFLELHIKVLGQTERLCCYQNLFSNNFNGTHGTYKNKSMHLAVHCIKDHVLVFYSPNLLILKQAALSRSLII